MLRGLMARSRRIHSWVPNALTSTRQKKKARSHQLQLDSLESRIVPAKVLINDAFNGSGPVYAGDTTVIAPSSWYFGSAIRSTLFSSSHVRLTPNLDNSEGRLIVPTHNSAARSLYAFFSTEMRDTDGGTQGGNGMADGWGFGYGPSSGSSTIGPEGQGGQHQGLWITMDTYQNGSEQLGVHVWYNGSQIADLPGSHVSHDNRGNLRGIRKFEFTVSESGLFQWSQTGGFSSFNFTIPNWRPQRDWNIKWGAVTGGEADRHMLHEAYVVDTYPSLSPNVSTNSPPNSLVDSSFFDFTSTYSDANGDLNRVVIDIIRDVDNDGYDTTDPIVRRLDRNGAHLFPTDQTQADLSLRLSGSDGVGRYYTQTRAWDIRGGESSVYSGIVHVIDDDATAPTVTLKDNAEFDITGTSATESHKGTNRFQWTLVDPDPGFVSPPPLNGGVYVAQDQVSSGIASASATIKKNGVTIATVSNAVSTTSFSLEPYGIGTFEITLTATDGDTDRGAGDQLATTRSATLIVTNDAPTVEAGPDRSVDEGVSLSFAVAAAHDADSDSLTYSWNFGDGGTATGSSVSHTYADDGVYSVTLTASDGFGGIATDTFQVTVRNKAPMISSVTTSGPVQPGQPFTITAAASDVPADPLSYSFTVVDPYQYVSNTTGVGQLIFDAPGIYPVLIRVLDDTGTMTQQWTLAEVGDPSPITPFVSFAASSAAIAEGGSINVELTLSEPIGYAVAVPLTISGSTRAEEDHATIGNVAYFAPGSISATIEISTYDDALDEEAAERLTLTLGTPINGVLGTNTVFDLDILDNDNPPTVWFSIASQTAEEDGGFASIVARLSAPSGRDVSVPLSTTGTAGGTDFTILGGSTLVFPAGTTTQFVRVQPTDDALAERNETIIVTMGTPTNATLSTAAGVYTEHTIVVPENDAPSVSIQPFQQRVTEGAGVTVTLTVELSGPHHTAVSVPLTVAGNAVQGSDYTLSASSVNFPIGSTTANVVVTLLNDSTPERLESLLVQLGTPTGGALLGPTATSVIDLADNDTPVVRFATSSQTIFENDTNVSIPLSVVPIPGELIRVYVKVYGGNATANEDYQYQSEIVVVIGANQTGGTAVVHIFEDALFENLETINFRIDRVTADDGSESIAVVDPTSTHSISIRNDDTFLSIAADSETISESSNSRIPIHISLSDAVDFDVNFHLDFYGGPNFTIENLSGTDFGWGEDLVIPAGSTTTTVYLDPINDSILEEDHERVVVGITSGSVPGRGSAGFTILDDDGPRTLGISVDHPAYIEGSEAQITLTLNTALSHPLNVPIRWTYFDEYFIERTFIQKLHGDPEWLTNTSGGDWVFTIPAGVESAVYAINLPSDGSSGPDEDDAFRLEIESIEDITLNPASVSIGLVSPPLVVNDIETGKLAIKKPAGNVGGVESYMSSESSSDHYVRRYHAKNDPSTTFEVVEPPQTSTLAISARSHEGYVYGATMFFDANKNYVLDFLDLDADGVQDSGEPNEPSAVTDVTGDATLQLALIFDRDDDGLIESHEGQLVTVGGIDIATGLPLAVPLVAPTGSHVITPFTTLMAALVNTQGMTVDEAEDRVGEALGLPDDLPLRFYDPIAHTLAGGAIGPAAFAASTQIYTTLALSSGMIDQLANTPSPATIGNVMLADLASKIVTDNSLLDLAHPAVVQSVVEGTLTRLGFDPTASVPGQTFTYRDLAVGAATVLSETNQISKEIPYAGDAGYLSQVVQVQIAALTGAAEDMKSAAAGTMAIANAVTANTGTALATQIDDAESGTIAPPLLSITGGTAVEGNSGQSELEFVVTLAGAPSLPVSVSYTTQAFTAGRDVDYLPIDGTLQWLAGDTSPRTIRVPIVGDTVNESDEIVVVSLFNALNAKIEAASAQGVIANDEPISYTVPAGAEVNDLRLELDGSSFSLVHNGVVVASQLFVSAIPILITGSADAPTNLRVSWTGLPGNALAAGVTFVGNHAADKLDIRDGAATSARHYVVNATSGSFVINDVAIINYSDVETLTERLAPSIGSFPETIIEGQTVVLSAIGADATLQSAYEFDWSLFRNAELIASGDQTSFNITPADDGSYMLQLTATAPGKGLAIVQRTLVVANAAPTVTLGSAPSSSPEMTPISLTSSANDPAGANDPLTLSWTVSKNNAYYASGAGANIDFIPNDNGEYVVTLTANDGDGGITSDSKTIQVTNVDPTVAITGAPETSSEGTAIALGVNANDIAGANDPLTFAWSVTKNGNAFASGSGASFTFTPNDNGEYVVTVVADDGDNGTATDSKSIAVTNLNPTVAITGAPATSPEGTSATLGSSASDAAGVNDPLTLTWNVTKNGSPYASGTGVGFTFTPNDNGEYIATVVADDGDGGIAMDSKTIAVTNVNPTVAISGAPASSPEGTAITLSANAADAAGANDPLTFAWSVTKNGSAFASGSDTPITFTPDDNGEYVATVVVSDGDGGSATDSKNIQVTNVNPTVAITGAPTTSGEGTLISLGAQASDAAGANDPLALIWNVTKNGNAFASGAGASLTFTPDDNGTYVVTVTATDGDGGTGTDSKTIEVTNAGPEILSLTGPASGVRGQTLSYAATDSDAGSADTLTRTWELRDSENAVIAGGSGLEFSFTPLLAGNYTVTYTVADDDGGSASASQSLAVYAVQLQTDPLDGSKTMLVVGGTTSTDDIVVSPSGGELQVTINGVSLGVFNPTSRIVVYAQGGNDDVQVAGSVSQAAWLYGGLGDDRLKGGNAHDVLIGGEGDDLLVGGAGRDLMIGGFGADRLVGNTDDDILIAGTTDFDLSAAMLANIMAEWTSVRTYAERVANLTGPATSGVNTVFLSAATVHDDNAYDVLTGSSGQDWFLFNQDGENNSVKDKVTDLSATEFAADLDFIND